MLIVVLYRPMRTTCRFILWISLHVVMTICDKLGGSSSSHQRAWDFVASKATRNGNWMTYSYAMTYDSWRCHTDSTSPATASQQRNSSSRTANAEDKLVESIWFCCVKCACPQTANQIKHEPCTNQNVPPLGKLGKEKKVLWRCVPTAANTLQVSTRY